MNCGFTMMYSMTGFGRAELDSSGWRITVELKAVNHRFLDVAVRVSKQYGVLEDTVRREIQDTLRRGRVEAFVSVEESGLENRSLTLDGRMLKGFLDEVERVQREMPNAPQELRWADILQLPDIIQLTDPDVDWDLLRDLMQQVTQEALSRVVDMRKREGQSIQQDMLAKLESIQGSLGGIETRAPKVVYEYRHRLNQRLEELTKGSEVDQDRLDQEIAIMAERSSIDEEIVRLRSHIRQFEGITHQTEPIGRKLDFLLQEMNREINTIASKAGAREISRAVVDIKSELEKLREQVQNIE